MQDDEAPLDLDGTFGRRVRAERDRRGWSQQELADRLRRQGLSWHQTTVAKTESGQRPARLSEAFLVSRALGLPLDVLLDEKREVAAFREFTEFADQELAKVEAMIRRRRDELGESLREVDEDS